MARAMRIARHAADRVAAKLTFHNPWRYQELALRVADLVGRPGDMARFVRALRRADPDGLGVWRLVRNWSPADLVALCRRAIVAPRIGPPRPIGRLLDRALGGQSVGWRGDRAALSALGGHALIAASASAVLTATELARQTERTPWRAAQDDWGRVAHCMQAVLAVRARVAGPAASGSAACVSLAFQAVNLARRAVNRTALICDDDRLRVDGTRLAIDSAHAACAAAMEWAAPPDRAADAVAPARGPAEQRGDGSAVVPDASSSAGYVGREKAHHFAPEPQRSWTAVQAAWDGGPAAEAAPSEPSLADAIGSRARTADVLASRAAALLRTQAFARDYPLLLAQATALLDRVATDARRIGVPLPGLAAAAPGSAPESVCRRATAMAESLAETLETWAALRSLPAPGAPDRARAGQDAAEQSPAWRARLIQAASGTLDAALIVPALRDLRGRADQAAAAAVTIAGLPWHPPQAQRLLWHLIRSADTPGEERTLAFQLWWRLYGM